MSSCVQDQNDKTRIGPNCKTAPQLPCLLPTQYVLLDISFQKWPGPFPCSFFPVKLMNHSYYSRHNPCQRTFPTKKKKLYVDYMHEKYCYRNRKSYPDFFSIFSIIFLTTYNKNHCMHCNENLTGGRVKPQYLTGFL